MAKILVTGSTGLVGGNLVRKLIDSGEKIKVLLRKTSKPVAFKPDEVEIVYGDITDKNSLLEALKDCNYLYHSAAMVTMWTPDEKSKKQIHEVNVKGTINCLEAALENKIKRMIFVSTVDALGIRDKNNPADETVDFSCGMKQLNVPYANTKHQAQLECLKFVNKGLDVVIVNPTFMFGAYDAKPSSGQMIIAVKKGMALMYSEGGNNFVDVEDVVAAMITAMQKGKTGECYILGNENLPYKEIFTRIAKVVKARPPLLKAPKFLIKVGGHLGDIYGKLTNTEVPVNSTYTKFANIYHYFNPQKARKELGLKQTPVEVAIERAYKWFLENKYL